MKRFILLCFLCFPFFASSDVTIKVDKNWHESDGLWQNVEHLAFPTTCAKQEVCDLKKLIPFKKDIQILDLGCGQGRHSIELAKQGFHVTGIDYTKTYLKKAKKRAKKAKCHVTFLRRDMRTFCKPNTFDIVLNLYSSFGFFTAEEDKKIIRNIYDSLKPGGRCVMEIIHVKRPSYKGINYKNWEKRNNSYCLYELQVSNDGRYSYSRLINFKKGKPIESTYKIRMYTERELINLFRNSGFKDIKTYDSFKGNPCTSSSAKIVLTARK